MKCGRQPGGEKVGKFGVCPAAEPSEFDGINKGTYGGRFCWAIAGTFCGGEIQGTFAQKLMNCLDCEFLKQVNINEERNFVLSPKNTE